MAVSTIDALYNGTSEKLTTSATGITVTGTVAATSYTGDGSNLTGVGSPSIDDNGNATAMTIDSDERVLIGQTTASSNTVGTSLRPDGRNFYCADGNYSAHFNRKSSDGAIAHFAKDDTVVGSIGTVSNTVGIHGAGSGDDAVGLLFVESGTGQRIVPCQENFTSNNGIVNLGWSTNRFKDAYLSGGVYLGGTGSDNKLSDVETGTWTPYLYRTNSNYSYNGYQYGTYEKIGRLVVLHWTLQLQSISAQGSSYNQLGGLPFTPSAYNANLQFSGSLSTKAPLTSAGAFYWAGAVFFVSTSGVPMQQSFSTGTMSGTIAYKTLQ